MREAWCHADAACQLLSAWYVVDFVSVKTYVLSSLSNRVFPLTDLTRFITCTDAGGVFICCIVGADEGRRDCLALKLGFRRFLSTCHRSVPSPNRGEYSWQQERDPASLSDQMCSASYAHPVTSETKGSFERSLTHLFLSHARYIRSDANLVSTVYPNIPPADTTGNIVDDLLSDWNVTT